MRDRPAWFYDETKQIGTDYEDLWEIQIYDQRMTNIRDVDREVVEVNHLGLSPEAKVLELGCGTEKLPIAAAGRYIRSSLPTSSLPMLGLARDNAAFRLRKMGHSCLWACHQDTLCRRCPPPGRR